MGDPVSEGRLPAALLSDIEELDLLLHRTIFHNEKRFRCTLVVRNKSGTRYLLKWLYPEAPAIHYQNLENEYLVIEKNRDKDFFPKVYDFRGNLLLLEYIDSVTMREWFVPYIESQLRSVQVHPDFMSMLDQVCSFTERFHFKNLCPGADDTLENDILQQWGKILVSGPMQTRRSRFELSLAKLMRVLCAPVVRYYVDRLVATVARSSLQTACQHGDLHLNNILRDTHTGHLTIVDWEVCSHDRTWLLDLAYFYSMVYVLLDKLPAHKHALHQRFDDLLSVAQPETKALFFRVCSYFITSISTNRRFLYRPGVLRMVRNYGAFALRTFIRPF